MPPDSHEFFKQKDEKRKEKIKYFSAIQEPTQQQPNSVLVINPKHSIIWAQNLTIRRSTLTIIPLLMHPTIMHLGSLGLNLRAALLCLTVHTGPQ